MWISRHFLLPGSVVSRNGSGSGWPELNYTGFLSPSKNIDWLVGLWSGGWEEVDRGAEGWDREPQEGGEGAAGAEGTQTQRNAAGKTFFH